MSDKYFENFSTISYANNVAVNLTQRAVVLNRVLQNPYLFYPLDISNGIRPDQLSDTYYNDQYMSWLLYFSNQIVDPYYEWYIGDDDYNEVLKKKYNVATVDILKEKIAFYRNNWYNGEEISVATYNTTIANTVFTKYWEPVYSNSTRPIGYKRVQQDWIINTNQIVKYDIDNVEGQFIKNEIIDIVFDYSHRGKAQVVVSDNSSYVTVQHCYGATLETPVVYLTDNDGFIMVDEQNNPIILEESVKVVSQSYLEGKESGTTASMKAATLLQKNIDIYEQGAYWEPVYVYDYEKENNEQNKSIKVLNASYAPQVASELQKLLK